MSDAQIVSLDRRAWEIVLSHIEGQLVAGALGPGDHLPPERQLAADLAVGRSSVREAIRVLEVLGLVRTSSGSGPNSGAVIVATPGGGMSSLMRLQVAATGFPVADVVKTRLLLETVICGDLAERAAKLPIGHELLDAMDRPGLAPEDFLALDQQFHLSLAEAAGNQVITAMMSGLRSSIDGYVVTGISGVSDWEHTSARLRAEHRNILRAIESGYVLTARTHINDHITGYYAETRLGE